MEAATGHHGLPHPGRRQSVERGGEGRELTGAPGSHHLHLSHHVVQAGARIEELTAQHHQHVLTPAHHSQSQPLWGRFSKMGKILVTYLMTEGKDRNVNHMFIIVFKIMTASQVKLKMKPL